MNLPTDASAMASVYTDFQGLNQLKAAAREQTLAAKKEAARQFEAIFIEMMLQSMRQATPKDSLFGGSQMRLYRGLYDHQIALDMAQGQGIGLRGMIEKALGIASKSPQAEQTPLSSAVATRQAAARAAVPAKGAAAEPMAWPPATPQDFIQAVLPYARAAAARIGVQPQVLIAQAALESGWGRRVPTLPDGRSSFNLFGIKAGPDWSGATVSVPTLEYKDGVARRERAVFRAYPSIQASFDDYARLISRHPRYRQAVETAADASAYLEQLQRAGYATDPRYAAKVSAVLHSEPLLAFAEDIKNPAGATIT